MKVATESNPEAIHRIFQDFKLFKSMKSPEWGLQRLAETIADRPAAADEQTKANRDGQSSLTKIPAMRRPPHLAAASGNTGRTEVV